MTNLDNVLKSRDITLPTKVHIVKAMVFPVVTYACESWTVKKAELQRIDSCKLHMMLEKTPESPLDNGDQTSQSYRGGRSTLNIHWKD